MTKGLVLNRGIDRYKWQTVYDREIGLAAIFVGLFLTLGSS